MAGAFAIGFFFVLVVFIVGGIFVSLHLYKTGQIKPRKRVVYDPYYGTYREFADWQDF